MNFAAFERAQVAAFAYREARHTGSLDCLRAVCFIVRNRVKSSWGDGTWLSVLESAHLMAATQDGDSARLGMERGVGADRLLQLIVRDVDDIYLGQEIFSDEVAQVCATRKEPNQPWKPILYYSFIDRPPRPWFVENIIQRPEHAQVAMVGKMMLFR
jgi:hypothetical protein